MNVATKFGSLWARGRWSASLLQRAPAALTSPATSPVISSSSSVPSEPFVYENSVSNLPHFIQTRSLHSSTGVYSAAKPVPSTAVVSGRRLAPSPVLIAEKVKNPSHVSGRRSVHISTPNLAAADKSDSSKNVSSPVFNVQDEDDFKARVLESKVPVIVDFHAGWCGPCKLLAPRLESIVSDKKGRVTLAKVDIDELSDIAMEYKVGSIPAVMALKDGKVVDQFVGLADDDEIKRFVEKLVGNK